MMIQQMIAAMKTTTIARMMKKMMRMLTMKKISEANQAKMKMETRVCKIQMTNAKQENKRKNKLKMRKVTSNQRKLDAREGQIEAAEKSKMK